MNLPVFKIRASAAQALLTNPRTKGEVLSKTTITYLEEWVKEQIYNQRKEISSKYLDKGLTVEGDAIQLYSNYTGHPMTKNEQSFEDDYFTGTPDVITDTTIIDIKSSWDPFTFPLFESNAAKAYETQLQVYMHLTGRERSEVVYMLMSYADFDRGIQQWYEDVPMQYRIKVFQYGYQPDIIAKLQERVQLCRDYIANELMPML